MTKRPPSSSDGLRENHLHLHPWHTRLYYGIPKPGAGFKPGNWGGLRPLRSWSWRKLRLDFLIAETGGERPAARIIPGNWLIAPCIHMVLAIAPVGWF